MNDVEQLKMILEVIQEVGGDAKEFGIWWLLADAVPEVLEILAWFIFGMGLVIALWKLGVEGMRFESAKRDARQDVFDVIERCQRKEKK